MGEKDRMRGFGTHRMFCESRAPSPHPSPRWGEGGVGGGRVAKCPVSRKAVGIVRRLRRAGVGQALLGEARLGGAVQLLRGGLVLAALLGKAVQGGAVQAFAGRLDRAAVVRRGGGHDAKRRDDDGKRFHVFLPGGRSKKPARWSMIPEKPALGLDPRVETGPTKTLDYDPIQLNWIIARSRR